MRYIPILNLKEGMVLAQSLLTRKGELFLGKGVMLDKFYLQLIEETGYDGAYVVEDLFEDMDYIKLIANISKIKGKKILEKKYFNKIEITKNDYNYSSQLIDNIVKEILSNKDVLKNIIDLKFFDDYTFYHSINVAIFSIFIGYLIRIDKKRLYVLGQSALLHDVGKLFLPKEILYKPKKLSHGEYEIVKRHPKKGYNFLNKEFNIDKEIYDGIIYHHERYDGKGYPYGLKGEEIPLLARIISVADIYDALTSNRPYRDALSHGATMDYIKKNLGNIFDPKIGQVFINNFY